MWPFVLMSLMWSFTYRNTSSVGFELPNVTQRLLHHGSCVVSYSSFSNPFRPPVFSPHTIEVLYKFFICLYKPFRFPIMDRVGRLPTQSLHSSPVRRPTPTLRDKEEYSVYLCSFENYVSSPYKSRLYVFIVSFNNLVLFISPITQTLHLRWVPGVPAPWPLSRLRHCSPFTCRVG